MMPEIYPCGPLQTNVYVLKEDIPGLSQNGSAGGGTHSVPLPESKREVVIVDAPPDSYRRCEALFKEGWHVHLFLTHGHWDHMADAHRFKRAGAIVYAHKGDRPFFEHPECMRAYTPPNIPLVPIVPDFWVEDGQSFTWGTLAFTVLHLPGHTAGQMGLYFPKNNQVFVGDTLFKGDVGRADLPTGNTSDLLRSIRTKLYSLPDETVVYPGHGPPTTVEDERKNNSFTRM